MANALNWFEIPVSDIDRAKKFYGTIFETELSDFEATPGFKMAMFPAEGGVGGAIISGEGHKPSHNGSVVYLNGGDDLRVVQDRVEAAGGKVLQEKMSIGENGFVAFFEDTEGNRVGLHSES